MTKAEILAKQQQLKVLFSAWLEDKKKRDMVVYRRENGDLIEHYPDGKIKVIEYAQ